MAKKKRSTRTTLVVGAQEMGKSLFISNWCKKYKRNIIVLKPLVTLHDDAFDFLPVRTMENWRDGVKDNAYVQCKMSVLNKKAFQKFILWVTEGNLKNGLLVLDDMSSFEKYRISDPIELLLSTKRHPALDIVMVYHGLSKVPNGLWTYCNYAFFYATQDIFEGKKDAVPKYDKLCEAIKQANYNQSHGLKSRNVKLQYTPAIVRVAAPV